jgi:ABC-type polysaccharide/polyol phosphate export permease
MNNSVKTDEHERLNSRSRIGWWLFGGSLMSAPVVFLIADLLSHPAWDWETSFFGHYLALPILGIGFVCCSLSARFSSSSKLRRYLLRLGAAVLFIVTVLFSALASMIVFGSGIR